MFRSLRRNLLDLRLFLYRSEFTGFLFLFFVFVLRSQNIKRGQKRKMCGVTVPVVCLAEGALGGGGFFGLWRHTQTQKNTLRTYNPFEAFSASTIAINKTKSPLFPLLAAWRSCQGRRLAVPRSPPSTSLHQHSPARETAKRSVWTSH